MEISEINIECKFKYNEYLRFFKNKQFISVVLSIFNALPGVYKFNLEKLSLH